MMTENEKETNSQKLTVKDLESTRKLGGNSGHHHHFLQAGGRVINGTGKNIDQVFRTGVSFFHFVAGRSPFTVDEFHCNQRNVQTGLTSHVIFHARTCTHGSRLRRMKISHRIAMSFTMLRAHSSSSSYFDPTPLIPTFSSWTTPWSSTSPSEMPCSNPCASTTRNEDHGPFAETIFPHDKYKFISMSGPFPSETEDGKDGKDDSVI